MRLTACSIATTLILTWTAFFCQTAAWAEISTPSGISRQWVPAGTVSISRKVLDASGCTFEAHEKSGPFGSYLSMSIPFAPVGELKGELEKLLGRELVGRGEAHVTVVTPVEYDRVLSPRVSISEINSIAREMDIQGATFEVLGLGRGQAEIDGRAEQTYYIIVSSGRLVSIRRRIFETYRDRGGEPSYFNPSHFYSHITVGFTKRDLHESDGIIKGINSLFAVLEVR